MSSGPKHIIICGIIGSFFMTALVMACVIAVLTSSQPDWNFIVMLLCALPILWLGVWGGIFKWLEPWFNDIEMDRNNDNDDK